MAPPEEQEVPSTATATTNGNVAADDTTTDGTDVVVGPDLNLSRSPLDRKLYRHITLPNGLQALLIQDTIAMQQQQQQHNMQHDREENEDDSDSDSDSDSEDDDDDVIEDDDESDDTEDEEDGGSASGGGGFLRDAACCILVGAGSASDSSTIPGLAHFLEHLLFMGSVKYPNENEYDNYVSKHGGSDNAYTEWEYTNYSLDIPNISLWGGLDRLAQFFISPLLSDSAIQRELNAIESEFCLTKNDDHSRRFHLISSISNSQHPMSKFPWGNKLTLQTIPEKLGQVDPMCELRNFYDTHYYAQNMRLAVQAAYTLDELQEKVVEYFSNIPSLPRNQKPANIQRDQMQNAGFPLPPSTLSTITRIVPVKERHVLTISWQVPSQMTYWKSKPCDFLSHLLGHEAKGSLLSYARSKSWATGCHAGCGDDGLENASSHAIFCMEFILSREGLRHWQELVHAVYQYLGMLRQECIDGWSQSKYLYQELFDIHQKTYKYGDEDPPDEIVEDLVYAMAPHEGIPTERLLDGIDLLFAFDDPPMLEILLNDYLQPSKARIDIMSSQFGKPTDFDHNNNNLDDTVMDTVIGKNLIIHDATENDAFDVETAGPPQIDPMFGTQFWCHKLSELWLDKFTAAAKPGKPEIDMLSLPPPNPFVPKNFDLKPLPVHDADHPLLHASLNVCISVGKTKQWFPATVVRYDESKNAVLLSYEDEEEQWHTFDESRAHYVHHVHEMQNERPASTTNWEGTIDSKAVRFRIVALASLPGANGGAVPRLGNESDDDCTPFPLIPPPSSRLPIQISNSNRLKMWWLQDRTFKRPIAELRLQLICRLANSSPLYRAVADLFTSLCADALLETTYFAEMCDLGCTIEATDVGFYLRTYGLDDKLLDLFQTTLQTILSFRDRTDSLPETVPEARFAACLETLERRYKNSGMTATSLSSSVRLHAMRPNSYSTYKKLNALKGITIPVFCETVSQIFKDLAVESLFHGNVDRKDADQARDLIMDTLDNAGCPAAGLPRKKYPSLTMLRVPKVKSSPPLIVLPSKDPEEANTAVEVYFQVGKDNVRDRVLMDLLIHMMDEPIYDQIRTKDQFGYDVHCDVRWSYGIIGCIFHVTTNVKSSDKVVDRINKFLVDFRAELVDMSKEDYHEHLVGLARNKLDMFNKLSEETSCLWSEIRDGRFEWEAWRDEAVCLKNITKDDALKAFDEWLRPGQRRQVFAVQVIGANESSEASQGRPIVEQEDFGDYLDSQVQDFHKFCKKQTWGRVNSKLF